MIALQCVKLGEDLCIVSQGRSQGGARGAIAPPGERDVGGALYGGKQVKFSRESTKT